MPIKMCGSQSLKFDEPPVITAHACVGGKKEKEGPLGAYIDKTYDDDKFGKESWEEAESFLQTMVVKLLLEKLNTVPGDIRYIISGDLLGQLIASTFGLMEYEIPFFGVYGACSNMGEAMALGAILTASGAADKVISMTSSHFASAEKQFRYPLQYGNQRPLSATWTVTGSGAVAIEKGPNSKSNAICIAGVTTGKIVDYGIKDSMNMGAAMAPACAAVIEANLKDFDRNADYYDAIITGDLGKVGKRILIELLKEKNIDISANHNDCGLIIYDCQEQDTHSGGSGCGCSAVTLCADILRRMEKGELKKVLFIPTGALLSGVSFNEGMSIPGIAHAVVLEVTK